MLRAGAKRRRSKAEIASEKEEAIRKQAFIEMKLNNADAMKARLDGLDQEVEDGWKTKKLIDDLIKQGVIREEILKDYDIGMPCGEEEDLE